MPLDIIKAIPLYLPDISTQEKIAENLYSLDFKIDLNNRINAELEAMAKTLYDYWFVQFDFPNEEGKPYKSSGGKMVWSKELRREIPEGWEVKRLGDICEANTSQLKLTNSLQFVNYLDTGSITKNTISSINHIVDLQNELPSRAQRLVKENSILYSTVRPIQEHHGILKEPLENMVVSTGFAVISHKQDPQLNDFIYSFLSSYSTVLFLQNIADTSVSAYPSINVEDIMSLKIPLPKNDLVGIKGLANRLDSINKFILKNHQQNQHLSQLRDWLLPMLMNGQVKVS